MIELTTARAMREWSREARAAGRRVAFVPTMGFLHEGHLRLVDRGREMADVIVVSVFVNPTQFGPADDFDRYPRDLSGDRRAAAARRVDCLFAPDTAEMYPGPQVVGIAPGPLADHLCGPHRPGHFAGVLLVVAKLLHIVEPDVAVFGRKDAQQARLVERMALDLNFPVEIEVLPTVREADGLALSSRNAYLSTADRAGAAAIPRALAAAHAVHVRGERRAEAIIAAARAELESVVGLHVDYVELVDPDALTPVAHAADTTVLAVAAHLGGTRLIDNIVIGRGLDGDIRLDP